MFSFSSITKNIELKENNFRTLEWSTVTETKIKQTILTLILNKASDSDDLSFIKYEYYSQCWRKDTEIILKKIEKSNYLKTKIYRMITLLNCLSKVSEKIITIKLSYLIEITDLLNSDQLKERRQKSAIYTVLSFIHDI